MDKCFKCSTSAPILNDAGRFTFKAEECFGQNKQRFDSDQLLKLIHSLRYFTIKNHAVFDEDCVLFDILANSNLTVAFLLQQKNLFQTICKSFSGLSTY